MPQTARKLGLTFIAILSNHVLPLRTPPFDFSADVWNRPDAVRTYDRKVADCLAWLEAVQERDGGGHIRRCGMSGATDEQVIELADSQRRLLLTEDKDFGQLVFAAAKKNSGVVLIRYPATVRSSLTADVIRLPAERGQALHGSFTVLQPGRARVISSQS